MAGDVIDDVFGGGAREGSGGASPEELAQFPPNDLGNAMRLILLAGGIVRRSGQVVSRDSRLLHLLGYGWIGFNGVHWDRKFGEELARKLAHQVAHTVRGFYPFWVGDKDDHPEDRVSSIRLTAKDFFKFCDNTASAGKTTAMMRQAQSYLMVEIDAFDQDPMALNCLNGTVKMRMADGAFRVTLQRHDPSDRITRCCGVAFDPEAQAPLFEGVVSDALPDKAERRYAHQALGYGSTGCTHEQVFFFFQGKGRDGKSTLLNACGASLGSYARAASPETFLEGGIKGGGDATPDLIALSGDTRLAIISEPKRGSKMDEGMLKRWTGGGVIPARDLHAKPIEFKPISKLFWEMNAFVVARGDDDGIWRRLRPVLFRRQVPKEKIDRLLPQKLEAELAGILNWLIRGVGDWLAAGKLEPPASLEQVVEDYRRASSPFGDWLAEFCWTGDEARGERVLSADLYASFKEWCEDSGNDRIMSAAAFGNALRDRQIGMMGKNAKGLKYRGPIRLKTPAERLAGSEEASAFIVPEDSLGGAGGEDLPDFDDGGGFGR